MRTGKLNDGSSFIQVFIFLIICCFIFFRGCAASPDESVNLVEDMGLIDVEVVEHNVSFIGFRGCSFEDAAQFVLRATDSKGESVTLELCTGWPFMGPVIRGR